jgi:hypothetical protein
VPYCSHEEGIPESVRVAKVETQLEILQRARLAKDVTGVHDTIAVVQAGLSRMIDALGERPL